jgi:DNA-binding SARP family transcriptional activator
VVDHRTDQDAQPKRRIFGVTVACPGHTRLCRKTIRVWVRLARWGITMAMRFLVLGPIEASQDGQPIPLGYAQLRCMLAVLLVEANHPVSTDQLIDRVWANRRLPHRPRRAVQHNIAVLRHALEPASDAALTRRGAGYQLTIDPDAVDLYCFRTLLERANAAGDDEPAAALFGQALALWRGEPFADMDSAWLHALRSMLIAQREAARLDLTDIRLRQGRHAALLAELADETTMRPLDERLAGQYLLALYRSGRQAKAQEHYDLLRRRLAEELGVDPSPPLQLLHQQILTADPMLTASWTRPWTSRPARTARW